MKYSPLGNTGLYVSQLTLGAMTFDREDGMFGRLIGGTGQELATRMVDVSIEAGVNLFDTANIYGMGESEVMLGKALGSRRDDVLVATKFNNPMGAGPNAVGSSRLSAIRECEHSLKRLGTDWIDLYQVHSFDDTTPLEETLRALDTLVQQGKVRYIGVSNYAAWQIAKADGISQRLGLARCCSVQAYYSLVGRELEREIIPASIDLGLGILVWSPLASGFLSGKYTRETAAEGRRANVQLPPVDEDRGYEIVDVAREIADQHGASVAQVSLAWLLHKPGVTSVIVGARKEEQLLDNLGAADFELTDDDMARLDDVSKLTREYPEWTSGSVQRGHDLASRLAQMG
ncbi:MAG: aldo/keto reductase [Ilumatobacter sp.]|uniref:aldo/keto reductase n=1 Tax=Ilumatobacter sp. TaxID=1967498 RepID=UPI002632CE0A|nr:aldo/keto reductase [Ilumatobacter sp.]MDJ0769483.1 aldo/keto reductase [Ilumatobacter sp.]